MQVKFPYKSWITIFLNFWVIILLVCFIILLINTLILAGIICLIIISFAIKGALNRNKRYDQIILALRISETTSECAHSHDFDKKHYVWKINDLYKCINYKEYWNETEHDKYWPKRIPYGLFCIYHLAQYWNDDDIAKTTLTDSEIKFANSTREDGKDFLLSIKNAEERHEKRLEKHIENMARITGKDYLEVYESVMDKENKRIEEFEKEKEERKKVEEADRILDNSAKMIFTGVTGKCPFCLKNISMLATKCPYCTANLRKQ